ncbi:MAG: hypothetical protein R3Y21_04690 [Mycoplasmatota bacterium]
MITIILEINKKYIIQVNKEITKIKLELQNIENIQTLYNKKVYLTKRGSIRKYNFLNKPTLTEFQMAASLYHEIDEYIDISIEIEKYKEQFSFIQITDDNQIRYTISKYSPYLKKYFNPNNNDIKVDYTFETMTVYIKENNKIKVLLFSFKSYSIKKLVMLYCQNLEPKQSPYKEIYFALSKPEGYLIAIGENKDSFIAYKDIIHYAKFYKTTAFKFLIYYEKTEQNINTLPHLTKIAVVIITQLTQTNISLHLKTLGITNDDYNNLLDYKTNEITSTTKKYTRKELLHTFTIEEKLINDFFIQKNLIEEINYEEIPNGELYI